jgi:hypothetical protein
VCQRISQIDRYPRWRDQNEKLVGRDSIALSIPFLEASVFYVRNLYCLMNFLILVQSDALLEFVWVIIDKATCVPHSFQTLLLIKMIERIGECMFPHFYTSGSNLRQSCSFQ